MCHIEVPKMQKVFSILYNVPYLTCEATAIEAMHIDLVAIPPSDIKL
jgi:hypothetical protein